MKQYDGINLHKHDMSKMAGELVKKMCKAKAKDRPEIDEVLEHPWFIESRATSPIRTRFQKVRIVSPSIRKRPLTIIRANSAFRN